MRKKKGEQRMARKREKEREKNEKKKEERENEENQRGAVSQVEKWAAQLQASRGSTFRSKTQTQKKN